MDIFYMFLVAGFALMVIEILTPGLFAFFSMGVAVLISAGLSFIIKDIYILLVIAAVLSVIIMAIMKKFNLFSTHESSKMNADRYIGRQVRVIGKLEDKKVRVKIYSEEWNGICEEKLEINDEAEILKIDGITLYLKKITK